MILFLKHICFSPPCKSDQCQTIGFEPNQNDAELGCAAYFSSTDLWTSVLVNNQHAQQVLPSCACTDVCTSVCSSPHNVLTQLVLNAVSVLYCTLCLHWSTTPCTLNVRKLLIGFDDSQRHQPLFPCLQENIVFAKRFLLVIMN